MAHERESFPTLQDGAGGPGATLAKRIEGDSGASQNGAIGFAFKDSAGNVILPQLNSLGQLPVTLDAASLDNLYAHGFHAGSTSVQTIATITLVADAKYTNVEMLVSSFQDSEFELVWNDNGTPTTLMQTLVGSGQYTFKDKMSIDFTAGSTGTQQLLLKGKNMRNPVSQLTGTITVQKL